MKFKTKYKLCLWKGYLDKGLGLTNYFKYVIAFFALASQAIELTIIITAVYGVTSFFLGWLWYKTDFVKAEQEVSNNFNIFVEQMRGKYGKI